MTILFHEIKKIWSLRIVGLITILCVLFYLLFMQHNVKYFPNGHPSTEIFNLSVELTERYGSMLEEAEMVEFIETRETLVSEAEEYISSDPVFAEAEIYSYEDYEQLHSRDQLTDAEQKALWRLYLAEEYGFIAFQIQAMNYLQENYSYISIGYEHKIAQSQSSREIDRLHEIFASEQYRGIMPINVMEDTDNYIKQLAILAVLSVIVLVSPLVATDRMRDVYLLQYTSKRGRRVLLNQLLAILISALMLVTLLVGIAMALYSKTGIQPLWNNGMTSFIGFIDFWFNITLGQYLLLSIGMVYLCAIGAALLAFALSKLSRNYISLILKLIPAFILFAMLGNEVFHFSFSMQNSLYRLTGVVGIEPVSWGIVLAAGLALSLLLIRRERRVDIL